MSGSGSSLISDLGDILIKGEGISFGEVLFNTTFSGVFGAAFAGIGYGVSKDYTALKTIINSKNNPLNIKPKVSNPKLKNIVDDLYKGKNGNNTIGNGTTMDAVRNELKTGMPTNGKFHLQKAKDYVNALDRILRRNDVSDADKAIAKTLLEDLIKAISGN